MSYHIKFYVVANNCGTPMLHSIQTQYSHSTCSYMTCGRPLNSHGLTVRLTVLWLFSRSHGKVLISHCHSFNLTVTHGFSLPSCLFFLWALIYKILSTS